MSEILNCEKCFYMDDGNKYYYECCCEFDKKQVLEDNKRALNAGYRPIDEDGDVRFIKVKKPRKKARKILEEELPIEKNLKK